MTVKSGKAQREQMFSALNRPSRRSGCRSNGEPSITVLPLGLGGQWRCNRDAIMNKALSNAVIWLLVAGYFLWVLADSFFHPASTVVSAAVNVFFVISIATLHGLRRYSLKAFFIFFVIAFIVSNIYENLSILTGFAFGHYHYTDALGPKLFLVPLLIAPAYFGCGYLAWSLAHVFVGVLGKKLRADQIWRV